MYLKNCQLDCNFENQVATDCILKLVRHLQEIGPSDSYIYIQVIEDAKNEKITGSIRIRANSQSFGSTHEAKSIYPLIKKLKQDLEKKIKRWKSTRFTGGISMFNPQNGATA